MGKIDFRTGNLTGSIGQITGARWKETHYVRTKTTPTNPRTTGQVRVRTIFRNLIDFGKRIVTTVLNPWIKPAPRNRSALNQYMTNNKAMLALDAFDISLLKIGLGSLPVDSIVSASRSAANNTVTVTWSGSTGGGALGTDNAIVVVYNEDQNTFGVGTDETRSDGSDTIPIGNSSGDDLHAFLFFAQGIKANSDTDYSAVS